MRIVYQTPESPVSWDEQLYAAQREAGLCQSTYWARVISRVDQAKPIHLTAEEGNEIVGQLLLFHKPPFDRQTRQGIDNLTGLRRGLPLVLEWLDGPVIHCPQSAGDILKGFLKWVERYALTHAIGVVRSNGFAVTSRLSQTPLIVTALAEFGYKSSKWATLLVDLAVDEEHLWYRLDQAARNKIRKCERERVRVRKIIDFQDYIVNYHKPYAMAKEAYGGTPSPLYVAQVMFEEDLRGYNTYFVAESQDGQVLATLGMYIFNGTATEMASALTPAAHELKIPAQDILHWEMIKYAKAHGCHTFNLAGIAPEPRDAKEAGIRRFKEKWGGRYVEYYRFEKVMWTWRVWCKALSLPGRIRKISRGFFSTKGNSASNVVAS